MKKHFYYAMAFLLFLTVSCVSEKIETDEDRTSYNPETVWEYNGDNTTLNKVIEELKSSPNREKLERRLLKNEVLWKDAKFLLIDNKKRIMVPFLSVDRENVIGVLALVKNFEGKTTFDMVVRRDLVSKSTTLPFWKRGIWNGYFMALDKDILGIKNGNPGLRIREVEGSSSKLKTISSKLAYTVCNNVIDHMMDVWSYDCTYSQAGEGYYCDVYYMYSYPVYRSECYEVPNDPNPPDEGGGDPNHKDPCQSATSITSISQSNHFQSAKTNIITASTDGKEHGISLGIDSNGNIIQGTMKNGGTNNVAVDTSVPGVFADIHNHPANTPLSAADIYALVKLNNDINTFTTKFIITDGDVYSIVINDLVAAKKFVNDYPADINPPYSPEFPDKIFYEIEGLKPHMGEGIEDRTKAMAYILDKYQSGISLLKQDSNGSFVPLKIQETSPNNFSLINCN